MKFKTYIRVAIALLLGVIIIVQVFELQLMQLWQLVNQRSFEERFCVNLEFPEMDCHGDCYLGDLLVTTTGSNSQNPERIAPSKRDINLFNEEYDAEMTVIRAFVERREFPPYRFDYQLLNPTSIFHPPQV